MTILIRALVSWLLALGLAVLVSVGALCLGFGNFVVAWQSFTAQGFEPVPLRHVPLLGGWAEGFGVGDAPLAALYALMLTLAMNLAILVTAKVAARGLRCFFDRRQALRSDDPGVQATAPAYLDHAVQLCLWAVILLVASVFIIQYDVAQFRFRYEDLFTESSDPADVLAWAPDAVARLGEYLASFIRTATWGYVGCVIAMAVALEYAITRAGENWQTFHNALEAAAAPVADSVRQAEAHPPALYQRPAVVEHAAAGRSEEEEIASFEEESSFGTPSMQTNDGVPVLPPTPAPTPPAPPPRDEGMMVNVIMGPGDVQAFPLSEVERDRDRIVRDSSGRAWFLRLYWEQVVGGDGHAGAAT